MIISRLIQTHFSDILRVSQTLSELLDERWTLDDLAEHNVLVKEQTTLKKIILDMENLVLANTGVDAVRGSLQPRFPRWLLPVGDNGSTMGIRPRTRPCTGTIGRGPLFIELIWR
jgi:hypothetical protein